jgi:hypothetical protein
MDRIGNYSRASGAAISRASTPTAFDSSRSARFTWIGCSRPEDRGAGGARLDFHGMDRSRYAFDLGQP